MQHLLAGLVVAAPFALGVAATPSPEDSEVVFRFADPAIVEASALVVQDGLFVTTNDSGDSGRVFAVDGSGETVGVTEWSGEPEDSEALAPGGDGTVWVGDIGDNDGRRSSIEIAQVAVGAGDRTVTPTTYRLTYPDGATDAEALLRDPATGRLYVATKNVFGGKLYAVPEDLEPSGTHQMEPVGRVLPIVTDGSFFPDGEHLIVRNYTSAAVYDWPSLQRIGSFALPRQRQGEGLAVADDGRIYLSSEGIDSQVLEVTLPPRIEAAMGPSASTPESSEPPGAPPDEEDADGGSRDPWPWIAGGLLGVGALLVLLRALRPRGSGERRPSG